MWYDNRGLSIVEYVLGGFLVLVILAIAVAGIARAVESRGSDTRQGINSMPQMPAWP